MVFRSVISLFLILTTVLCDSQLGPDPWDYVKDDTSPAAEAVNIEVPPDLMTPLKKKTPSVRNFGSGEWFFKRALAIMLNGGQTKVNEDGSTSVLLQMKIDQNHWQILNELTKSDIVLTDELYRRSIAYVEEAILQPSILERITVAWSEYVQTFLLENKTYIVWTSAILAAAVLLLWLWKHMSHKQMMILGFVALYIYEIIISYKEAEKMELEKFMAAVRKCNWYFFTCEVPAPDLLVFMKHMNPLKIALRMFTTVLSEPMITISATVNTMVQDISDGLWFPFNVILRIGLIVCINIMLIVMLIMIIFNYILNIPFSLRLGLGSINVKQRKQTMNFGLSDNHAQPIENADRISEATLDKILHVFSRALDNNSTPKMALNSNNNVVPMIKRSASTGRLPNFRKDDNVTPQKDNNKKNNAPFMIGGGDGKIEKPKFWKRFKTNKSAKKSE